MIMESIKHFTGRRNPVGPDSDRKRTPMRNFQRRGAAIATFAFAFAAAPVIGLGAPAISRADDHNYMSGWTWDNVAQQCVISPVPATTAPAQNGPPPPGTPGGVYGPGGWGGPGGPGGPPASGEPYGPYGPQGGAPGTPGWPGGIAGPTAAGGHAGMGGIGGMDGMGGMGRH